MHLVADHDPQQGFTRQHLKISRIPKPIVKEGAVLGLIGRVHITIGVARMNVSAIKLKGPRIKNIEGLLEADIGVAAPNTLLASTTFKGLDGDARGYARTATGTVWPVNVVTTASKTD